MSQLRSHCLDTNTDQLPAEEIIAKGQTSKFISGEMEQGSGCENKRFGCVITPPESHIAGGSHPIYHCLREIVPNKQLAHCSSVGKIPKL